MVEKNSEKKTEKKQEHKKSETRTVPRNIRQVGESCPHYKIYVEDYVVTYLNQLAHPTNRIAKGAILLGEWGNDGKEETLYISGAVEAANLSFNLEEITFTNETWSDIYKEIENYFSGMQVVGWFLSRLGYSVALSKGMEETHKRYFTGEKTVLYLADAIEQEDAFYYLQNGSLLKAAGYYIYYERNTPMQDYLVDHQVYPSHTREENLEYKDSQVLHSYHEIMAGRRAQKEEKRVTKLLYATSALLTLAFLALGVTVFNNYDRMKRIQNSLQFLAKGEDTTVSISSEMDSANQSDANSLQTAQGANANDQAENGGQAAGNENQQGEGDAQAAENENQQGESDVQAAGNENQQNENNGQTQQNENGQAVVQNDAQEQADAANNKTTPDQSAASQEVNAQATPSQNSAKQTPETDAKDQTAQENETKENSKSKNQETQNQAENTPVMQATSSNVANYYTVQPGDTLLSICQKVYHSENYVEVVKQANEMSNGDIIYPGQQIVLPSIDEIR